MQAPPPFFTSIAGDESAKTKVAASGRQWIALISSDKPCKLMVAPQQLRVCFVRTKEREVPMSSHPPCVEGAHVTASSLPQI